MSELAPTLKDELNFSNPNQLADYTSYIKLGNILRQQVAHSISKAAPAVNDYNLSTVQCITLPEDAKAAVILRASVRAGGTAGEYTAVGMGTTPSTTNFAVTPNGDIGFLGSDAVTDVDVVYIPQRYDIVELTLPAPAGVVTIPTVFTTAGVKFLIEAEAITATNKGKKIILVPGTTPATTKACLNVAKTQVLFNSATDAVTVARVKLAYVGGFDIHTALSAAATF